MKNQLFVVILFSLLCSNLFGQTEKHSILLGGTIGGSYKHSHYAGYSDIKGWQITTNPRVGYFLFRNFAVGFIPSYTASGSQSDYQLNSGLYHNKLTINNNSFSFDPFIRFYYLKTNKVGLSIEGAIGYNYSKSNNEIAFGPSDSLMVQKSINHVSFLNYQVGPGFNYFVSEKAAIELGLYYQHNKVNQLEQTFDINKDNLAFAIGLMFFL